MSYLLKSKPKRNYNYKFISIALVFVSLFLLSFIFPSFFKSASQAALKPLWILGSKSKNLTYYFGNFFILKGSLIDENTRLKDELALLRLSKLDYDFLQKENEELRSELGRGARATRIVSNILSKPPQSPFDTFVIDGGENVGLSVGDKVYISDTIIAGLISHVGKNTSTVRLFSTGGQKNEVVLSRTGAAFELKGEGGANFSLEIPKDADVVWGDSFEYPNQYRSIVGVVYFVDSNSQSSFKTIHARIPGNAFQAKQVFIEKQ